MGRISDERVERARELDLLTYLRITNPGDLVDLGNGNFKSRKHGSLKMSNGLWHWFAGEKGGRSALDYLTEVERVPFPEAIEIILGERAVAIAARPAGQQRPTRSRPRILCLPDLVEPPKRAADYLLKRGIHPDIVDYCVENRLVRETKKYHNALFLGYDARGTPRYGALRGTMGDFKGELSGSDKRYGFLVADRADASRVHVFESAIDALSYATLMRNMGDGDWQRDPLLSLGGVARRRNGRLPMALEQFLKGHENVEALLLHLDNDEPGREAASHIAESAAEYRVEDRPPPSGKDVNEFLLSGGREREKHPHRDGRDPDEER